MTARPTRLDIYRTAIEMRSFEHAAASRGLAEAVVVRLELSDGSVGWGETLPRQYVTGETLDSAVGDIERMYVGMCRDRLQGQSMSPLEMAPPEADRPSSHVTTAAACALEIALADAVARSRGEPLGGPISGGARVSGVLGSRDPARTAKRLRLMRLYGLRDFKLKTGLGDDVDAENLNVVRRGIGKAVEARRCTLRVDVNGGWTPDQTPERIEALRPFGVCVVEQPVFGPPETLIELAQRCRLPLMADESVLTFSDAERFIEAGGTKVWLNIRLSKNGGIGPCRRIAAAADRESLPFVIGCMVGESSILSAAQRVLLSQCRRPRFVEGNYGRFLLKDDLTRRSLRFGFGGRIKAIGGPGLGVRIDLAKLDRYGRLVKTLSG